MIDHVTRQLSREAGVHSTVTKMVLVSSLYLQVVFHNVQIFCFFCCNRGKDVCLRLLNTSIAINLRNGI